MHFSVPVYLQKTVCPNSGWHSCSYLSPLLTCAHNYRNIFDHLFHHNALIVSEKFWFLSCASLERSAPLQGGQRRGLHIAGQNGNCKCSIVARWPPSKLRSTRLQLSTSSSWLSSSRTFSNELDQLSQLSCNTSVTINCLLKQCAVFLCILCIFCFAFCVTLYLQQWSDWLCKCQRRLSSAGTVQQLLTDVLLICFCWSDDLVTQLEENDVILGWSQVSTLEQPHNQNLLTHSDLELGFPQKRRLSKAIGCHWLDWYQSIGTSVTFIYKPHGSELVWTWVDLVPAHSHGSIPSSAFFSSSSSSDEEGRRTAIKITHRIYLLAI